MRDKIILIRHGDDPLDDRVYTHALARGFEPVVVRAFAGDVLGVPDETVAGTVIFGGGYNVDAVAEHPFLRREYRWIEACLAAGVPMLGICQGGQQLAHLLGATVGPMPGTPHEFGYYPIDPVPGAEHFLAGSLHVCQAHFHGFELPPGAELLASGGTFPHQAFRVGESAFGLQFHPEVTPAGFRRWQDAAWAMFDKPGAQDRAEQDRLMAKHDAAQDRWFRDFLDRLFGKPGPVA